MNGIKPTPGVIPNLLNTGAGSPTGIIMYEGKLLPEPFRNRVIHCDALPRVVRAYPTQVQGAGYHAEITDLLTLPISGSDRWTSVLLPMARCMSPIGMTRVSGDTSWQTRMSPR